MEIDKTLEFLNSTEFNKVQIERCFDVNNNIQWQIACYAGKEGHLAAYGAGNDLMLCIEAATLDYEKNKKREENENTSP